MSDGDAEQLQDMPLASERGRYSRICFAWGLGFRV